MNNTNDPNKSASTAKTFPSTDLLQPHANPPASANQQHTQLPHSASHQQQMRTIEDSGSEPLVKEGKSNAITINTPFTVIPGLPALSKILKKIDKTTNQDLGFTFKGDVAKLNNPDGSQDIMFRLNYSGFGVMSPKFNVQYSPYSVKIESGTSGSEAHWGCNASILSTPTGSVHGRLGGKGGFEDCSSTRTFSTAAETSYQKSTSFKPLSTATVGRYWGDTATLRIPAAYIPTLERIKEASPSLDEWKTIAEHIAPSIPAIQIGKLVEQNIEIASKLIKSGMATVAVQSSKTSPIPEANAHTSYKATPEKTASPDTESTKPGLGSTEKKHPDQQHNKSSETRQLTQKIEPSLEEKAHYTVQQHDTLAQIGNKTGHPWTEILAMNQVKLKNNPDHIYPGQELLIPENHSHAELLKHPAVLARIAENLEKHGAVQHIKPSLEEKAHYTVQQHDTLAQIGNKTGHPWTEILAMNQVKLKNNPDHIYPGQELLIPENHSHAELLKHPAVLARILENKVNQYYVTASHQPLHNSAKEIRL